MKQVDFFYIVIDTAGSLGNGNPAGTAGDCPKGFVCLKNGNCGGILNMEKIFFVVIALIQISVMNILILFLFYFEGLCLSPKLNHLH